MLMQSRSSSDLAKSKRNSPDLLGSEELSAPQVLWGVLGALPTSVGSEPCARVAAPGRLEQEAGEGEGI